jgi:predicted patatin/cPLA2 family phospholipase
MIAFARRSSHPAIAPLLEQRPTRYNAEADFLEKAGKDNDAILQINPPVGTVKVSQLERSERVVRDGLIDGAKAAAKAFGVEPVDLFWQPQVYAASD